MTLKDHFFGTFAVWVPAGDTVAKRRSGGNSTKYRNMRILCFLWVYSTTGAGITRANSGSYVYLAFPVMAIVLSCWTPQQALPYSFKSIHHLSASVFTVLFLLCAPLALPSNCSRNPTPNAPIYFPTTRRLLLMDDADFRATYKVPASAPANRAPQPTLAALGLVAPGSSSHSLLAPTHPLIAPIATITTQHPHPALAASGPLTTADGTCSPPTTTHTPSSVALGKRCLVEILFDDEADPVASTSIKVCVLSNVQIPDTLEENLITTSTLNLWYELSAVCSEVPLQVPNCDDRVAVSCNDIRKFCQLFQYLDLPHLAAIIECHRITGTSNTKASKELGISLHKWSHTCPGYSSVLMFKRIVRKRRSVHTSDNTDSAKIVYDNDAPSTQRNKISTFTLNAHYTFAGIDTEKKADANTLSCSCDDIAAFVAHYTQSSMTELKSIARVHRIGEVPKKPAMRQELIRHSGGDECPGQGKSLLFSRIPRKRNGPFKVIERSSLPADAMDVDKPTIESMDNLRIMPVAFTNDIVVDIEDGTHFCSTYLLHKIFEFAKIVSDMTLRQIHLADMDIKFVAVHASSLANLSPALSNDDVGKLVELKCEWRRYDHDMERKVLLVYGILALHVAIV
ncbi:hypothetical protein C8J57DRAFT_1231793 [Mycena rebaudengoi]|nr:hypothetical protein C8J57DRAFT_1231793 [Mycena rebaudengoi]